MSKVFFDVGVSLDGFLAGPNRGPTNPLGDGGFKIHQWLFETAAFRERIGLSGGQTTSTENRLVSEVFARAGAHVMGRRMFEEGAVNWPESPPFQAPVFVLSHSRQRPWRREGGTTFYFVTEGIDSALDQARAAAGGKDVRISGGAETLDQFLRAGLVDDFTLHVSPVLLGRGVRLLDHLPTDLVLEQTEVIPSTDVTHIRYRVLG